MTAVAFDIGGVLLDWNPRHLYRGLFDGDDEAMEAFLATVCTPELNAHNDRGRPLAEGVALLSAEHPDQAELIEAFASRWPETVAGPIDGSVQVLAELVENGTPVYVLSNWSAETFALGFRAIQFHDPPRLRAALIDAGMLPAGGGRRD